MRILQGKHKTEKDHLAHNSSFHQWLGWWDKLYFSFLNLVVGEIL